MKKVRLSPLLAAILASSTVVGIASKANAETQANYELQRKLSILEEPRKKKSQDTANFRLENKLSVILEPINKKNPDLYGIEINQAQAEPTPTLPPFNPPSGDTPEFNPPTPTPAPAPEPQVIIAEIVVTGVEGELVDLVYNTIATRPGRTTTRSRLEQDVEAIYATGFFSNVSVTPEDTPLGVRLNFIVTANPVLTQVVVETQPATETDPILPPEVITEIFGAEYGKILNLRTFQENVQKLNEWYKNNGYDLAQVVDSPQISPDGTVTIVVAQGVIQDIQVRFFDQEQEPVEGNTRDFIITREMELKSGDVFNRNIAQRDLQRIFGLGIFEDVRFSFAQGQRPGEVIINVDVVEGSTGSLSAGAGISSASGLFGTVSYQQKNLGGNNQSIGGEIQVGTREILFNASFTDPWIGGDPYRTSYTVDLFRRRSISLVFDGQDTSIETANGNNSPRVVRTGAGVTFTRPIAENPYVRPDWRLSAGIEYQYITVQNADGEIAPRSSEEDGFRRLAFHNTGIDNLVLLNFSASRDTRDNPLQATKGSVLRLSTELSALNIYFNRLRANYSYYIPVKFLNFDFSKGPQAIAFNVQAGTILGEFPPYEAFVLGGSNSVRGYGEGELGSGKSYFQATAEYRFPIYSVVGGAVFVDFGTTLGSEAGVIGNPSSVRDLPGTGFGYGIGVRVQSPLGPIRVDYGFNNEGDSRIHFGIGERF